MKKWLVLLSATVCVSFSGIFVRLANVSGFVSAFYRILFALAVIAPAYFARKKRNSLSDIIPCVLGGFVFGLELALWNISVVLVNATVPTLLVNLSCIWIGLFSYFALKEKLGPEHWIGTIISMAGVCLLIGIAAIIRLKIETGVLYALACSFMISIYTLIVKKAADRKPGGRRRHGLDRIGHFVFAHWVCEATEGVSHMQSTIMEGRCLAFGERGIFSHLWH